MISPEQIKQKALTWWIPFLRAYLEREPFFPKKIERIGKVTAANFLQNYTRNFDESTLLYEHSKANIGYGYTVFTVERSFRKFRNQKLPDYVQFDTINDYILYIGKEREWAHFQESTVLITSCLPILKEWLHNHPDKVITHHFMWGDLLKVCQYFINCPRPMLYLRELPIDVNTKFIEKNTAIVRSLLDYLLDETAIRDKSEKDIEKRYYLRYDEPRVRLRILDSSLVKDHPADISIRLSDFHTWTFSCNIILLAENKMNTLTIPLVPSAIVIWTGGGFNVSYLENVDWLKDKRIYYWGDLDIHGFEILHQMRSYYPQTKSVLMDKNTFRRFSSLRGEGEKSTVSNLPLLEVPEKALHKYLKSKNWRLEQEKIPQDYVNAFFLSLK